MRVVGWREAGIGPDVGAGTFSEIRLRGGAGVKGEARAIGSSSRAVVREVWGPSKS